MSAQEWERTYRADAHRHSFAICHILEAKHPWIKCHIEWVYRIFSPPDYKCDVYFDFTREQPDSADTFDAVILSILVIAIYRVCDGPRMKYER